MTDDPQLLRQLRAWNPWWQEGVSGIDRFGVPDFEREQYAAIRDTFAKRTQAVSIVGMRQVGKTTIMHQCIRDLLRRGMSPKTIFFLSFEDSYLLAKYNQQTLFHDVLELYASTILGEDLATTRAEIYVFFDEVHRLPRWAQSVKTYIDRAFPITFMVSGSASIGMQTTKGDSLLGRMVEFTLYPFSFSESVSYWQQESNTVASSDSTRLRDILTSIRTTSLTSFNQGSLSEFATTLAPAFRDAHVWYGTQLRAWLQRYLLEGGFPRVWQQTDEYSRHRYLIEQHIQKVIREDLPQLAKIRKVSELEALYIRILERIGDETVLKGLATETNISMLTLDHYLKYLRQSFLIFPVERTKSRNVLRQRRASRVKFYAVDPSVRAAILKTRDDLFEQPTEMGVYVENLVATALLRRVGGQVGNGVWYYREGNRYEVDFILKEADSILPIEVKWRQSVPTLLSLDRVRTKWKLPETVVVTRDNDFTYHSGRLSIPLWFFLLAF